MSPGNNTPPAGIRLRPRASSGAGRKLFFLGIGLIGVFVLALVIVFQHNVAAKTSDYQHRALREVSSAPASNIRADIQRRQNLGTTGLESLDGQSVPPLGFQPAGGAAPVLSRNPMVPDMSAMPMQVSPVSSEEQAEKDVTKAETEYELKRRESGGLHSPSAPQSGQTHPQQVAVAARNGRTVAGPQSLAGLTAALKNAQQAKVSPALQASLAGFTGAGAGLPGQQTEEQQQAANESFVKPEEKQDDYLKFQRERPRGEFEVQAGTNIPAILTEQANSSLPGELTALVRGNVYDALCGQVRADGAKHCYVMIPAGSKLIGTYNSTVGYGQERLQVVWTRLFFPDSSFLDLAKMNGHAADGAAGLHDQVDSHWRRTIGGVVLSSLLSAGFQISQNRTTDSTFRYPSNSQLAAGAFGQQANQAGQQLLNRNLNVPPTIKIRTGQWLNVVVNRDIVFEGPYKPILP